MRISAKPRSATTGMAITAIALTCFASHPVMAQTVVSSTGVNLLSSPPASVVQGQNTSNSQTTAFQEQQDLTLLKPLRVNISTPGTYDSDASLTPSSIAAGTKVNSFLFYSDPTNNRGETFTGSITFDSDILGAIVLTGALNKSDVLGAPGTIYPTGAPADTARGLELSANQDSLTLSPNDRTLTYSFHTTSEVDEVRVITAAAPVPEASTTVSFGLLLALGFSGVAVAAGRKKFSA